MIALEPEAASIWCQGIQTEVKRGDDTSALGISVVGTRYMIVDLGGIHSRIILLEHICFKIIRNVWNVK